MSCPVPCTPLGKDNADVKKIMYVRYYPISSNVKRGHAILKYFEYIII